MGDVAAKSESQGSVGVLAGYALGVSLLTVSHSAPYLYSIFALAVPLHLGLTQWMLKTATFELLTLPRLSFLAREFLATAGRPEAERRVSTIGDLEREGETGMYGEYFKKSEDRYVVIAPGLEDIVSSTDIRAQVKWTVCVEAFEVRLSLSTMEQCHIYSSIAAGSALFAVPPPRPQKPVHSRSLLPPLCHSRGPDTIRATRRLPRTPSLGYHTYRLARHATRDYEQPRGARGRTGARKAVGHAVLP